MQIAFLIPLESQFRKAMPAVQNSALIDGILSAYEASGASVFAMPGSRGNPRKFVLVNQHDSQATELWIYAWTLTPGGRPSLPYEYRIQITSPHSPLPLNPSGPTVLLGYKPDINMFAGFDLSQHRTLTGKSPSVQVDIRTVEAATASGLSFEQRTISEIAVGIRPDQLLNYTINAAQLHALGRDAKAVDLLRLAVDLKPLPNSEMKALPLERMRVVQTISMLSRDSSFRKAVLTSYNSTCAVTSAQLQLVDAAHILPVGAKGSSDVVQNGICLAPTYHRAYDLGIIYVDERYMMRANPVKIDGLRSLGLSSGERRFIESLGPLKLPKSQRDWPGREMIRQANAFRGVTT